MTMVSYAQNHEDVLLDRAFPRGKPGFYIDVGANEPVRNSVTRHFYELGWHGINVEPATHPFGLLAAERERDVNLNVAVSDAEGELTLYELPPDLSAGSTLSDANAARHREAGHPAVERTVPTLTLAQICERHADATIDFLSVDVEGHEREVLAGGDWKKWRPRIVVVEATEPTTTIPAHEKWEGILLDAGYLFAAFDGLNRYYVREEDADLAPVLAVPVNCLDDYTPHELSRQLLDLGWAADQAARQLAASRAVNATLLQEYQGFARELNLLRARYEKLERALTATRAQCEAVRAMVVEGGDGPAEAPPAPGPMDGVSPASLAVARRLTGLSAQHPKAAAAAKTALRKGLQVKRSLSDRSH
jgi:FkbM family methyltransferase